MPAVVRMCCFLIGDEFLSRRNAMDSRKKEANAADAANPPKPLPQNLLRKMIASGKSVQSKVTNK